MPLHCHPTLTAFEVSQRNTFPRASAMLLEIIFRKVIPFERNVVIPPPFFVQQFSSHLRKGTVEEEIPLCQPPVRAGGEGGEHDQMFPVHVYGIGSHRRAFSQPLTWGFIYQSRGHVVAVVFTVCL